MKTHTFRGVKYDIDIGKCDGSCDRPVTEQSPSLQILLDNDSTLQFLETAIHEALHACKWSKREKDVDETARDISKFLWRLGYRK